MMRLAGLAFLAMAAAGCATTTPVEPQVSTEGQRVWKIITTTAMIDDGGGTRLPAQTFRHTFMSGKKAVYAAEWGALTWPFTGSPLPRFGLCLDDAQPGKVWMYNPTIPGCMALYGKPPELKFSERAE